MRDQLRIRKQQQVARWLVSADRSAEDTPETTLNPSYTVFLVHSTILVGAIVCIWLFVNMMNGFW